MMKDLSELAAEYYRAAELVGERIEQRRKKLRRARAGSREAGILRDEICTLYRERRDTVETANKLKNYYGGAAYGPLH